ncbi:hypothetical protein GCM10009680_07720 [Streptomyces yatensis]|uniref:Uncharacterized protein n=1 Tax=Streptomyces yatensis TaxID=155177 RepID=A0ABN2GG78_9ACTN
MRGRLIDVQRGGQQFMAQRHHHLDHTGHTRRTLRMADVGLQRAEPQRPALRPVLAVRREQRLGFDRVAERGARAMCLHRVHLGGGELGVDQRLADHPLLGGTIGRGEPVGRAVLVDGRAPDHREHLMSVALCVGEPFQQQEPDALREARAVGGGREGLAAAVGGESALAGEFHEGVRRGHHGHATGQGQGAFALPQRLAGEMHGDQR